MTWGWNVALKPSKGNFEPLKLGKICKYRDKPTFHYWVRKGDRIPKLDAFGIREGVLVHAIHHDVEDFFYYEAWQDTTWWVDWFTIMASGVRGKTDDFGPMITIPIDYWGSIEGRLKVPYIDAEQIKYASSDDRLEVPDTSGNYPEQFERDE